MTGDVYLTTIQSVLGETLEQVMRDNDARAIRVHHILCRHAARLQTLGTDNVIRWDNKYSDSALDKGAAIPIVKRAGTADQGLGGVLPPAKAPAQVLDSFDFADVVDLSAGSNGFEVGAMIETIRADKKTPKGLKGRLFWVGNNKYGPGLRGGIESDGVTYWVLQSNCKVGE